MSHTDDVKYPQQPTFTATVANQEALIENEKSQNCGAKCFMTIVSLVFVLLGLAMTVLGVYTITVLHFGGQNVLTGYSMASVIVLLVVGLVLLGVSIAVWVSSCKPNNCCSKFILTLFSIVMVIVFIVEVALIVLGCMWLFDLNTPGLDVAKYFNETVEQVYDVCCVEVNGTAEEICNHVLGDDKAADCASENTFYTVLVSFLKPLLDWVFGFLGVVAFLNIVAFACSCCLICSKARSRATYKPAVTYQNGGV
jgi:hypothetical protein